MPVKNSKTSQKVVTQQPEVSPVVEQEVVVVAESSPVVPETPTQTKSQKGGKKAKAVTPVLETPTQELSEVVQPETPAPVKAQKGGKKAKAVVALSEGEPEQKTQKGGKQAKKQANVETVKKVAKKVVEQEGGEEPLEEESGDRRVRSFKVRLPGNEDFCGRFTGLTPYQAANKALSKFFRENKNKDTQSEITFSICESTRKSRKGTYTYVGRRQKLDTPVTYTIQDGREIRKEYKNSLKKVKKSEASIEEAQV